MNKLILTESQNKDFKEFKLNEFMKSYFTENDDVNGYDSFSIENLKNIKAFSGRIQYCGKFLKRIGTGSSRIVYELPDGSVLKLAKNKKGLAQCESEVDVSNNGGSNEVLAKVIDFDEIDNYVVFVIMEKATKAKSSDFKNDIGVGFEILEKAEDYALKKARTSGKYRSQHHFFIEYLYSFAKATNNSRLNDFTTELENYIISFDITLFGDIVVIKNWGVINGNVKLIDYGLTDDVFRTHYS